MSFKYLYIVLFLSFFFSCSKNENETEITNIEQVGDLPDILKKGKLTVYAENSSSSYFIYRGNKMGFEYELLDEFAQELGVELEIKPLEEINNINDLLNHNQADLIACNYAITKSRKKDIDFSIPYLRSSLVLVQRNIENQVSDLEEKHVLVDPIQLIGKQIYVVYSSSAYQRLLHLEEEIGDSIHVKAVAGNEAAEDLLEQVANGEIDYTVVSKNVAQINEVFFDNLNFDLELSVRQRIAFPISKNKPLLKARLNQWLQNFKLKPQFKYLKQKYFDISKVLKNKKITFQQLKNGDLSPFDRYFKREAKKYGIPWQMMASIAYQESKFNANITGFGGAYGLMQFMPGIGPKFGVYPNSSPEKQIEGGCLKFSKDIACWPEVKDKEEQMKFALASYNAGFSHIKDAQRLAKKHGLSSTRWDNHVEKMVRNLSKKPYYTDEVVKYGFMRGSHTANYVKTVFSRFKNYKEAYK